MKKILFFIVLGIFVISLISHSSFVVAKEGPPMPPSHLGKGDSNNSEKDVAIQIQSSNGNRKGLLGINKKIKNVSELRKRIREQKQIMNQSIENYSGRMKKTHRNKNQVKMAVHSLLAIENLTGGIGKNVSRIAKEFNNSINSQVKKEEKIVKRSGFRRLLAGGDFETANQLVKETNKTKKKILKLKQLKESCNCTSEVRELMQEQILEMEQEQERMNQIVSKEKSSKGLFGWIWK